MKIAFKESCRLNPAVHFERRMWEIFMALCDTTPPLIGDTVLITSANDSRHGDRSLHYKDHALDVRILGNRTGGIRFPSALALAPELFQRQEARAWRDRLAARLGRDYDVVLEADHLHIEYDPEEA